MEQVRGLSKKLLGGSYRLEVMSAIREGDLISLTSFYEGLIKAPSMSCVAKELRVLEQVGLLERQPTVGGMREVFYVAASSSVWGACRELSKSAADRIPSAQEEKAEHAG